eukprot:g19341.t1
MWQTPRYAKMQSVMVSAPEGKSPSGPGTIQLSVDGTISAYENLQESRERQEQRERVEQIFNLPCVDPPRVDYAGGAFQDAPAFREPRLKAMMAKLYQEEHLRRALQESPALDYLKDFGGHILEKQKTRVDSLRCKLSAMEQTLRETDRSKKHHPSSPGRAPSWAVGFAPSTEEAKVLEPLEPLELQGPIASLSVPELRSKLQDPEELQRLEFTDALLARRAVWEYETFIPRVLSWHDFQYNTFWFFIKERGSKDRREEKRGYFGPGADDSKMFAHEGFFMEDRCGLCTLVWCFSRQRLRHQRLFEKAAVELQRTLRVRSLAPRNFQNTMIAYRWFGRGHHEAVDALPPTLAQWLPRLLDGHDERTPKLRKEVMFSYTCQDGSVVPADAFRINGLNLIARGFLHLDAGSAPSVEACFESMTDYVLRSGRRSPNWMRSDGDLCQFALVVAEAAAKGWPGAASWLERLEAQLQLIRANARPRELSQLETALEHAKMAASAS